MNKRHETAGEGSAERQREGEVRISPRRGGGEQVRERGVVCEAEGVWKTQGSAGGSEM